MLASRKRQLVLDLGLALACIGMVVSGLLAYTTIQMGFWLEDISASGYRDSAVWAMSLGTIGLLLCLLTGVVFGASRWVYLVPIAGLVVLGFVATDALSDMAGATLQGEPFSLVDSVSGLVVALLISPTGWPLCLMAGAAVRKVLRARRYHGPRPTPGPSSAPTPRSSAGS